MKTEEQIFLEHYDITKYDRPSMTVDTAVFSVKANAGKPKLSVLLVKRGGHPFKGRWALPGGFLKRGETAEECACRETKEETGVEPGALLPVTLLCKLGRDVRGWVISQLYAAVVCRDKIPLKAGDDADEATWFDAELIRDGERDILMLTNGETRLIEVLKETKSRFGLCEYEKEEGVLAFDHAEAIASALSVLRSHIFDFDMIFDFLLEKFTLNELQNTAEAVSGKRLLTANFRRMAALYVEATDEFVRGKQSRQAKLYRRKG